MKHIILTILLSLNLLAQDVEFVATVNKNPVTQGEQFQVSFTVNQQASNFKAPAFTGFNVLQGPSTSQSTSIVNGRMSYQLSYNFILTAKKEGEFFIGPASIKVNGKTHKTQRIKLKVVEPTAAEKLRRQTQQKQEEQQASQAREIINKNFFVKLKIDNSNVFQGEQITATYKLYIHPDLDARIEDYTLPVFNGFWTQDIDVENIEWTREVINGVPFRAKIFKKVILYPQYSGKIKIDPLKLDVAVTLQVGGQNRRRSILDDFWGRGNYKTFKEKISSNSFNVNVKELPEPKPLDFTGAVGEMKFEAWLDKTKTKTNEPITLKVKINGKGNLKLLNPSEIDFPPDFEVYEPKLVDNSKVSGSGISGNVIFEYLIIPRNPGQYKIDPFSLSWFDIETNTYKTFKSDEYVIDVEKGDGTSQSNMISGVSKENVQYLGKDIRFIKSETQLEKIGDNFFGTVSYYTIMGSPILAFLLALFYKKKQDEEGSDSDLLMNRQANKVAKKRLSQASKLIDDNDKFYEELSRAMWDYLSHKLSIPTSNLTKDSAKEALLKVGINEADINSYLEVLDTCELARYAPIEANNATSDLLSRSESLIKLMEENVK